jgi:ankyrin repeat protein
MKELTKAIDNDNLVKMKSLLKEGIDLSQLVIIGEEYELDEPDEIGILFYAIRTHASLPAIELLLSYGIDIFELDENGVSILDTAIKFRRIDIIKLCIDRGFDLNSSSRRSGIKPLMLAACFGDITIVKLLLDNGADINDRDRSGMSPKDYARKLGQKKMEEFLTQNGGVYLLYRATCKLP